MFRRLSHLEAKEQEEEEESELSFDADSEDVMGIHLDSVFSMNANSVGINYTVAFIIQKYGFKGMHFSLLYCTYAVFR
jgi:hypothetical protein